MTVSDLLDITKELEYKVEANPELLDKEVRYASQPNYPFEYSLQDNWGEIIESEDAIYFAEGTQLDYLSQEISEQLGW